MLILLKAMPQHPLSCFHEPTEGQKRAGNYRKTKTEFGGLPITIENEAGSVRRGRDHGGKEWATTMTCHYGYIRGTVGADGDHYDVFIGPDEKSRRVWIIQTMAPPDFRKKDEEKAMLGFGSESEARASFLRHYDNPAFLGAIREMPFDTFKRQVMATRENGGKLRDPKPVRKCFIVLGREGPA
ncbi:hypothetical protein CFR73_15655 [Novacetimonas maltaceti]|uniref:Inorganic pyrophosphatase domain-containing protein n=1 Tax=Novacetimonas maltaceti TaxID=1203393 RepID=A0A2S3VXI9_9PROT|nr:hypothetical protein [Novacetimonas maltaceti]POF61332.1 hypothetical protein KMAL_30420 [Novacetimonas maltaceti]PYD57853.1 hypothetical protein CFR73_15655 [Novacetimonas maltaceti]